MTTSLDPDQITRKINFLTKEIQIPDVVSDAVVSEIQKILNNYEKQFMKYGQQLVNCVESNSQFERCSNVSNDFMVNSSNADFHQFFSIRSIYSLYWLEN